MPSMLFGPFHLQQPAPGDIWSLEPCKLVEPYPTAVQQTTPKSAMPMAAAAPYLDSGFTFWLCIWRPLSNCLDFLLSICSVHDMRAYFIRLSSRSLCQLSFRGSEQRAQRAQALMLQACSYMRAATAH